MFNAQDLLGQLMQAGSNQTAGRRVQHAMGSQSGAGGILGQLLGGGAGSGGQGGGLGGILGQLGGVGAGRGTGAGGGLGDLLGGLGGALGGSRGAGGRGGVTGNPMAMGGIGALAGAVLGRGNSTMGNAIGGGALALLGSLAMSAFQKMNEQKRVQEQVATEEDIPLGVRPPQTPGEEAVLASKAMILMQAMISAAKADGQIDGGEMERIVGKLEEGGADGEGRDFVLQEMRRPLDLDALVAQVQTPELAAEVYAASLLAIEVDTPAEHAYLKQLAQKLRIDPAVVAHLHSSLGLAAPA